MSRGGFTDAFGYNPSYGTYIGGGASNATGYLYAGGYIHDGTAVRTLLHSSNYNSYAMSGAGYSANQNLNTSSNVQFTSVYALNGNNAYPATSGAASGQTGMAFRARGGDNAILDIGMYSVNTWLQATDMVNLGQKYNILLNPNGGKIGIGMAATPQAILDVNGNGSDNIIRVSNGVGNYRWRVDQTFSMIMTNASGSDTFSVTTAGNVSTTGTITFAAGDRAFECSSSGCVSFYSNEINAGSQGVTGPLYIGWRRTSSVNIGTALNVTGNLLPSANNTYNLGSSSVGWANIYTNDLHLSNMNKPEGNDIDGTNGTWTIQEGAENLYIINNNNGKKFKISLEEIL